MFGGGQLFIDVDRVEITRDTGKGQDVGSQSRYVLDAAWPTARSSNFGAVEFFEIVGLLAHLLLSLCVCY